MRSELVATDAGLTVLHLVNYSDYAVENITVHPRERYAKATLYRPEGEPEDLEMFENGEVDIPKVVAAAILVLEPSDEPAQARPSTPAEHEHGAGQAHGQAH
jgi:hypothetical protein